MKEHEASDKWCPFVRIAPINGAAVNRSGSGKFGADWNCIGSECMAWRLFEDHAFKQNADAEFKKTGKRLVSEDGFCGLAGRP